MDEYVDWNLENDYYNMTLKFIQLVLLKSFEDEFDLPRWNTLLILSPDGNILMKGNHDKVLS